MRPFFTIISSISLTVLLSHCSSVLPSGSGFSSYYANIGTAWRNEIIDKVPKLLELRGYQLFESRIQHNDIRFSTNWQTRRVFPDEIESNITSARIRVTVEARSRGLASFGYLDEERFAVSLIVENSFQIAEDSQWVQGNIKPSLYEYIRELEREIRQILEIRI